MRQQLLVYGLLFVLLVQTGAVVWLQLWKSVDKQSLTEYLCENVDKPQLDCHGTCAIDKVAVQQAEDGNSPDKKSSNSVQEIVVTPAIPVHLFFPQKKLLLHKRSLLPTYRDAVFAVVCTEHFQPPRI